jgi:hypothetical protein
MPGYIITSTAKQNRRCQNGCVIPKGTRHLRYEHHSLDETKTDMTKNICTDCLTMLLKIIIEGD